MAASIHALAAKQSQRAYITCVVYLVLLLELCIRPLNASLENDFVSLPPEFASKVPARLVFNLPELVQCWQDTTADRCVLKESIKLEKGYWQQAFGSTGGIATLTPAAGPLTITSEPCNAAGVCLPGSTAAVRTLDFNMFANSMLLQPGAKLVLSNVQIFNLAPQTAYSYSSTQPYKSTGQGTTTWPSIALAHNATLVLVNSSVLYYNPSDTDDCAAYTQKRIFAFRQVWGEKNISQVNATSNLIVGPQTIEVTIRNASTDSIVANATAFYRNVTFTCMPNTTNAASGGVSPGALAAAIAVPVGIVLLAAGGLLLWCCLKRRRHQQQATEGAHIKDEMELGLVRDVEEGEPLHGALRDVQSDQNDRGRDQVKVFPLDHKGDGFSSSKDVAEQHDDAAAALPLQSMPSRGSVPSADQPPQDSGGLLPPPSTRYNSQALHGSGDVHGSDGLPYPSSSLPSLSRSSRVPGMDDRLSSVSALLKARSDVAVLRDLKIGPLLGRGSYGRVYRGRWKATPVAVKIIEHHAAGGRSSGGKTISAGRETLLATSVSHPNVVTCFHISTMSMSQRSALASSWLEGGVAGTSSNVQAELEPEDSRDVDDSDGSTISSDLDESPPDLLETWIIMEFCEKGSLERAVRLGKFKRKTGGPGEMVGIYKALLDTASGLDYLHSIGVVHGDLKTANVLLKGSTRDARGVTCKITDFGLSRVLDPEATHISTGTYGTIVYMPKELLLSGRMNQATDIYSFGLMMWELFTGQAVMEEGLSIGQMFYMIAYENWRPQIPEGCPKAYADLMTACWQEGPERRPTAQRLLRRLQRLYVQTKQEFLSARAETSQQAAQAAAQPATAFEATPAATAAGPSTLAHQGVGRGGLPSGGFYDARPLGLPTAGSAAAGATRDSIDSNIVPSYGQQEHQHQREASGGFGVQPLVQSTSARLSSSVEEGGIVNAPAPPPGRRSHSSEGPEEAYQPYVQAVLQRSTSMSSPVLGRPTTPRPWGLPAPGVGSSGHPSTLPEPEQLQQQLAQLQQDPAAQQQLLSQYAVLLPPMLPIPLSSGAVGPFQAQQGAGDAGDDGDGADTDVEAGLFTEDGIASESLLQQLMSPSNAPLTFEADEQYSGYLHPPSAAGDSMPAVQSMQQTVELYRQQLQYLQQQSALAAAAAAAASDADAPNA